MRRAATQSNNNVSESPNRTKYSDNHHNSYSSNNNKRVNEMQFSKQQMLLLSIFFIVLFVFTFSRLFRNPTQDHFQHQIHAQLSTIKDWIATQYYEKNCKGIMSNSFERIGKVHLENPTFTEGLKHWVTSKGNPSVQKEKITSNKTPSSQNAPQAYQFQNSYWLASDPSKPVNRNQNKNDSSIPIPEISCSYQFVDFLEDWKKLQLFDDYKNLNFSQFFGKIDNEEIVIELSAELRRPNLNEFRTSRSKCSTRNHFCDITFNDHVWIEAFFYTAQTRFEYSDFFTHQKIRFDLDKKAARDANDDDDNDDDDHFNVVEESKVQINRKKISSLRTTKEDLDFWNERKVKGIIPKRTRGIKVQICSQHRAGESNEGMADDVSLSLYQIPTEYRPKSSKYQCTISKEPMMRLIENGKYLIVWETNANLNSLSCNWGWRSDRLINSEIVQTTQVDDCHFVHKCSIHFENYDDHDDDDDHKLAELAIPLEDNIHHRGNYKFNQNQKEEKEEAEEEVEDEEEEEKYFEDDHGGRPDVNEIEKTGFYYSIQCGDAKSPIIFHRLIPPTLHLTSSLAIDKIKFEKLRVAIVSDNQYGSQIMRHIITDLSSSKPDFIMMGGDSVDHGAQIDEWYRFFWQPLQINGLAQRTPIVLTRGNHDGESSVAHAFTSPIQNRDWFSFTSLSTFFIVLDSNADDIISPMQTEWLRATLQSDQFDRALFRVVLFHLPPFTELWSIKERYNGEEFVRDHWVPLFEQYKVDLVITGHTHAYLQGTRNGVVYAIVGGAGGDIDLDKVYDWQMFDVVKKDYHYVMMEFSHCFLDWKVYNPSDSLISSFVLPSKNPLCKSIISPAV